MKPLFLMRVPCGAAASSNLEELQPQQRETFFFSLFTTAILRCIPIFEGRSVSGISQRRSQKSLPGSCFPTNTELRRIAAIYGSVAALAVRRVGAGWGREWAGGGGVRRRSCFLHPRRAGRQVDAEAVLQTTRLFV